MKVLHVVGGLDFGGIEKWLSNFFAESQYEIDNYIISMHPHKRGILPYLNLNIDKVYFANRNNFFSRICSLIKVIKEQRPNVVHCHAGYSSGIYSLVAKLCRVKTIVVHSHSDRRAIDVDVGLLKKAYIFTMKLLLRKLTIKRLAVSEGSAQSLFDSEYVVMYCGVPVNNNEVIIDSLDNIDSLTKLVFHIGRYTEAKNFPFILELLERFRDSEYIHFVFISGELEEFSSICNAKGIFNVTFLGQVSDPSSILYKYADVFILPSKWEGLPLSAVEAQLSGVSCILSSTITREVDLGMATFIDLDLNKWESMIYQALSPDRKIDNAKASRFSIHSNFIQLKSIYANEHKT